MTPDDGRGPGRDGAATGPEGPLDAESVRRLAARLDAVLERVVERADPEVTAAVVELVDGIQRVHAEALRRLVELLAEEGEKFRRALADPVISNLLLLYDLAIVDERRRAERAIGRIQELAHSHGGEIQLVGAEDGVVTVRLLGACHGCPSSTATLRGGIERALSETLPGFVRLEVEGAPAPAGTSRPAGPLPRGGGLDPAEPSPAAGLDPGGVSGTGDVSVVPEDRLVRLEERVRGAREATADASPADGRGGSELSHVVARVPLDDVPDSAPFAALVRNVPLLLLRLRRDEPAVRAYRNACPGTPLPLHLGKLEEGTLVCPWHGCRFDPRTGDRRSGAGPPLEAFPVRVADGEIRVTLP